MILVADAFDAITTERTYRPASTVDEAIGELRRQSGVQFDPAIVRALECHLDEVGLLESDLAEVVPLSAWSPDEAVLVSLAFPVVGALALGLVLGGRLGNLAELRLRASWLFFVAIALQVVAFPFAFLPWRMDAGDASLLWLTSYGFLIVAAFVNRRITGVPIVALGMCMNVAAIVANGGTMPVSPRPCTTLDGPP